MRSSSTSLRSLVMPYRYPINRMRSKSSRIDRRSTQLTVALLQTFPHKIETNVLVDEPQQMIFRVAPRKHKPGIQDPTHRAELVSHYQQHELPNKTPYTLEVYTGYLNVWILPKWSEQSLSHVR